MSRVVHFEVHAAKPERVMEFYTALLGWRFEPWGPPGTYWLIRTGPAGDAGIDGGLVPRRGEPPSDGQAVNAFVCTVAVTSAADTLARAVELGGSVALPVIAIAGAGWLGYAKDPDGNLLGFMQTDPNAA
jgi:uncharacterized protein